MAKDPYKVLGVDKSAGEKDIKSAFRKLAKKWHPDTNNNSTSAKENFNAANQAYEILGDKTKRQQYDRGEIGPDGAPRGGVGEGFAGGHGGRGGDPVGGGGGFGNTEDILREMFGGMGGRHQRGPRGQGFGSDPFGGRGGAQQQPVSETKARLSVSVADLMRGDKVDVQLPSGKKLAVAIPPGTENDDTLRLRGQGEIDDFGRKSDLLLEIQIQQSRKFQIIGKDVITDFHVPLSTAVHGGKTRVETPHGALALTIAPWTNSGKSFRIKGKGLPAKKGANGDLILTMLIDLPSDKPEALSTLLNRLAGTD